MSNDEQLITLTADMSSSHLGNNTVAVGDVLISRLHAALAGLSAPAAEVPHIQLSCIQLCSDRRETFDTNANWVGLECLRSTHSHSQSNSTDELQPRFAALVENDVDGKVYDEPSEVFAEAGAIVVERPDGVAVTLTPQSVSETGKRLQTGAEEAEKQRQERTD